SERRWQFHGPHWWGEEAWWRSENPHHVAAILDHLNVKDGRKFRLAAAGSCRLAWDRLSAPERALVEAAEAYADRRVAFRDLQAAAEGALEGRPCGLARGVAHREARLALPEVRYTLPLSAWGGPLLDPGLEKDPARANLCRGLAAVVREVFGNPFRPAAVSPAWRTPEVLSLARGIYEERAFERMPV